MNFEIIIAYKKAPCGMCCVCNPPFENPGYGPDAGCLSKHFDISRINDGDGIEATLQKHMAKFHNTCRLQYSKTRLQRAMKRKSTDTGSSSIGVGKKVCRQQHPRQQNRNKDSLCLFCEKPASPSDPLHEAMTKMIGERVKRCATKSLMSIS